MIQFECSAVSGSVSVRHRIPVFKPYSPMVSLLLAPAGKLGKSVLGA